ncbi:TPA: hypothetical protein ACH3X1_008463 [Trebouxia sp. C0004]
MNPAHGSGGPAVDPGEPISLSDPQKYDSLSSELASSEQRQGPPIPDLYWEAGRYKPPLGLSGYIPSDAGVSEQSKSGGAQDSEANRGSKSRQLSGRLDWDMPFFTHPVSTSPGNQKHSYSHGLQQHDGSFSYDHDFEYPARRRGDLYPAHPSVQQQHGHETLGYDCEMGLPGFTAGPQSNGWVSDDLGLSISPLAAEQQRKEKDDGMGMAAAQSGRQQQRHEESSTRAAQMSSVRAVSAGGGPGPAALTARHPVSVPWPPVWTAHPSASS